MPLNFEQIEQFLKKQNSLTLTTFRVLEFFCIMFPKGKRGHEILAFSKILIFWDTIFFWEPKNSHHDGH